MIKISKVNMGEINKQSIQKKQKKNNKMTGE
jgi:hypothetical protein